VAGIANLLDFADPVRRIADCRHRHDEPCAEGAGNVGSQPADGLVAGQLGAVWWVPKLAVVAYLCIMASFLRRRWPMFFAVSVSGLAVLGNISHF
jgi:hypothetical protein